MSEAMTTERVAEAEWLLKGYWAKMRFPFQTKGRGWSDVDVLAYHPEKRHLVISESKVRGPKTQVYAYTADTAEGYGSLVDFDNGNYLSFIQNIEMLCTDGTIFNDFQKMVDRVTVQLISNYYVAPDVIKRAKADVLKQIPARVRKRVEIDIRLDTTIDVIANVLKFEQASEQGRRYGHPVIDMAREMNRYVHAEVRYAGRTKVATDQVREGAVKALLEAIGA